MDGITIDASDSAFAYTIKASIDPDAIIHIRLMSKKTEMHDSLEGEWSSDPSNPSRYFFTARKTVTSPDYTGTIVLYKNKRATITLNTEGTYLIAEGTWS